MTETDKDSVERAYKLGNLLGLSQPEAVARCTFTEVAVGRCPKPLHVGRMGMPWKVRSKAFTKHDFGRFLLKDLVSTPVQDAAKVQQLLDALGHAMRATDEVAAATLWDKICDDALVVKHMSEVEWAELVGKQTTWPKLSIELIAFLALKVNRPRMCSTVLKAMAAQPAEITRVRATWTEIKKNVPSIVATIFSHIFYVTRRDEQSTYEEDLTWHLAMRSALERGQWVKGFFHFEKGYVEVTALSTDAMLEEDDAWMEVVNVLGDFLEMLPSRKLQCSGTVSGSVAKQSSVKTPILGINKMQTTLLDVAVLCSEVSPRPVLQALKFNTHDATDVLDALRLALVPNVLRSADSLAAVVLPLYQELLETSGSAFATAQAAWQCVITGASWWQHVDVMGLKRDELGNKRSTVRVQVAHVDVHPQSPDVFEKLMTEMANMHNTYCKGDGAHILHVMLPAVATLLSDLQGRKTNLLMQLAMLMNRHCLTFQQFKDFFLGKASLLDGVLQNHPSAFPYSLHIFRQRCDEANEIETTFVPRLMSTLRIATKYHLRDHVHLILDAVEKEKGANNVNWLREGGMPMSRYLCEYIEAFMPEVTPGMRARRFDRLYETRQRLMKRDFDRVLQFGDWTDAHKRQALACASRIKSGLAVQILVSAPYEVELPHDPEDPFVRHIFDATYAPDEAMPWKASSQTLKRRRDGEADTPDDASDGEPDAVRVKVSFTLDTK